MRKTVEETLNALLDEEAPALANAARYELKQTAGRPTEDEHYERKLLTTSGEVTVKMPKLKGLAFQTAIIERYRRGEAGVEEAMAEMYLAGVSTRRVQDITELLWDKGVSAGTVSSPQQEGIRAHRGCGETVHLAARHIHIFMLTGFTRASIYLSVDRLGRRSKRMWLFLRRLAQARTGIGRF